MTKQPEYILEENLVNQLVQLCYKKVTIKDEGDLIINLKAQLEKHNNVVLSDNEFKQVLNQLTKGNIFEKAKILRDKVAYTKDDSTTGYLELVKPAALVPKPVSGNAPNYNGWHVQKPV